MLESKIKESPEWQGKIEFLASIISSLSASERNLSLSALDFQSMGLSKKHQIEAAIERAAELGKVLDDLIVLMRKILGEDDLKL